jgi:hypothetical protein
VVLLSNFTPAGLAHRAEHSPRKREAGGSSPPASTSGTRGETVDAAASEAAAETAWRFKSSRVHQSCCAQSCRRHASSMTPQPARGCSLRQAAKASVLHTDIPRFESWSEHHSFSRSSMAERPADNRKIAVRYRAGEPTTRAIAHGPGAFKPETVGQRAFNPRARGSTPPGSSNGSITCTRLAQSVERRPLKSEVRGSSPRSCTNSTCDASVEADPLSTG